MTKQEIEELQQSQFDMWVGTLKKRIEKLRLDNPTKDVELDFNPLNNGTFGWKIDLLLVDKKHTKCGNSIHHSGIAGGICPICNENI